MISFLLTLAAATVSPTPQPTQLAEPSPTNTTVEEIQKIREVVQQKVKEKLKQISTPATVKQGLIGKVVQIDDKGLSIEYQSTTKTMTISDDLTLIDLKRNKTKYENLKVGQDILVLGIQDNQNNTFQAKRIVFITMPEVENNHLVVVGKIVDISRSSPVFSLIPVKNKNTQYQIKTDTKTQIVNQENTKLTSTDLKSGDKIITILVPDPKMSKTYYAVKIINQSYSPAPTPTVKQ